MKTKGSDIRAILFDKDGTLVDFNRTWFRVCMVQAEVAAKGDPATARRLMDMAGYDFDSNRFRPDSVIAAGTIAEMTDLWHPDIQGQERQKLIESYDARAVAEGSSRPIALDGLIDSLNSLTKQGYLLGIGTNDSQNGAWGTTEALGITSMFASVLGFDSVARPKPFPDMLLHFAKTHNLEPSQIAMVGDNNHDLEMAHAAGAGLAIGVLSGTGNHQSLSPFADIILPSIKELPGYMAGCTG